MSAMTGYPEPECLCTWHYESRGGGYTELVAEFEPICFEHGDPSVFWWDSAILGQCSQGRPSDPRPV